MPNIVASNSWVLKVLSDNALWLAANRSIRLFTNDIMPTSANVAGDFTEADFVGYTRKSSTGIFPTPVKLVDGWYQTTSSALIWNCTGGSDQTVYGWYLLESGTLRLSQRFPTPKLMTNGGSLSVTIALQEKSIS